MAEKPEMPKKATYATEAEVPAEYTKLYSLLNTQLDYFEQANRSYPPINSDFVFGAHLLVADSNRGPILFHFTTIIGVELTLYRFKRMGVQGITLVIGYPLLMPGFKDNQKYLTFYSKVARAVRKHGMKLLVELNVLFVNSELSPFEHDFGSLSFERFIVENWTMAQLVIDRLQPDFLTILHEPQTFSVLAGFDEFYKPYKASEYVNGVLNGLKRHNTMVGAGAGNWDDLSYFKNIAASAVDYLSLHIYSIDKASIHRAYEASKIAVEANKPLVIT